MTLKKLMNKVLDIDSIKKSLENGNPDEISKAISELYFNPLFIVYRYRHPKRSIPHDPIPRTTQFILFFIHWLEENGIEINKKISGDRIIVGNLKYTKDEENFSYALVLKEKNLSD